VPNNIEKDSNHYDDRNDLNSIHYFLVLFGGGRTGFASKPFDTIDVTENVSKKGGKNRHVRSICRLQSTRSYGRVRKQGMK
jgi:hypothetical protein